MVCYMFQQMGYSMVVNPQTPSQSLGLLEKLEQSVFILNPLGSSFP